MVTGNDNNGNEKRTTVSQPTERLVSFGEASQLLGHAERTLRWWAAIGKITTHKFGEPTSKGAPACTDV
jgi:hypothetical protein